MEGYLRGQVAKLAKVNFETLRYYENNGLIPTPERTNNGYRWYPPNILERLEFIRNAKEAGFTLKQIKELFSPVERQNANITDLALAVDEQIRTIEAKISRLESIKNELVDFKDNIHERVMCPHIRAFLNNFNQTD